MVPGSELTAGQVLHADCENPNGTALKNFNASDPAPSASSNPHRKELSLWYHATTDSGVGGMINAIYLDITDQRGYSLPAC